MKRTDRVFMAVMLALHVLVIVTLPGGGSLSDGEIMSLTGGLLGADELAASMRTGSVMPHPTPFWVGVGIWARITRDPWLLRLPSIVASLLTIVLVVRLGIRHVSRMAGMTAGVVYACSPAAAGMARTFGPDSGLLLALLLAVNAFLSGWKRQGSRAWVVFLLATVFMLYWHVYGLLLYALVWCALGASILWYSKLNRARDPGRPPVGEAVVATALAGVLFAPWFVFLGRLVQLPPSPVRITASSFYDAIVRGYGSGSVWGFVPLLLAAVFGAVLGLRTERVSLATGRVLLSTKSVMPTFYLLVLVLLYVPCLFAFHRTTATAVSTGGTAAILPLFLLLVGIGVSRLIPYSAGGPNAREFALLGLCGAVLGGLGWRSPPGSARVQASIWEEAASFIETEVRAGDMVLVSPDDMKVYMVWAASRMQWAHLVRGENWLARYDAGPNLDRVSTIWLCEGTPSGGQSKPRVKVTRLVKVGGLDIGTAEAAGHYVDNIDSRLERSDGPGGPFTFSWALGAHARLNFPLENNRPASVVIFRAEPYKLPQKVSVDLNKRRKTQVEMGGGWRHYLLMFEPPEFLPGHVGRVDLRFSTHRPDRAPDGTPLRMKAVALDYVVVFARQTETYFPEEASRQETERQLRQQGRLPSGALETSKRPHRKANVNRPPVQRHPQTP
ncbi:glycosyltransferase family 39 protein [Candidatus Fermentibacteria bacterium]|nr:glycosyltransferase family 39 protein [Candidatus Fermentibacteria bacterium]